MNLVLKLWLFPLVLITGCDSFKIRKPGTCVVFSNEEEKFEVVEYHTTYLLLKNVRTGKLTRQSNSHGWSERKCE